MLQQYPRTPHLVGSRYGDGDGVIPKVPLDRLRGRDVVVTEKLDGANVGISFDAAGHLRLQSRWDDLDDPPAQPHLADLATWAAAAAPRLRPVLRDRFVLFGEWLGTAHTLFYDALPDHFCGFDVLDRRHGRYLAEPARAELLDGAGTAAAPVLFRGRLDTLADLTGLLGPSRYRTRHWRPALVDAAALAGAPTGARSGSRAGGTSGSVLARFDGSELMEGLYVKVERAGRVLGRYKWVRPDFRSAVRDPSTHWQSHPLVRNGLRAA